jgi:hypothetical protein
MTADSLEIASAVFAIAAAALWVTSSLVKWPREFTVQVISYHISDGESMAGSEVVNEGRGTCKELETLGNALIRQGRLSAAAAGCVAISAICQGAVIFLHRFSPTTLFCSGEGDANGASRSKRRKPAASSKI